MRGGGESKPGEFLFGLPTKSELELKSNMETDMYGFNVNQQLNMMAIAVAECAQLEVSASNSCGNSLNTQGGFLCWEGDGAQNSHVCISTEDVLTSPPSPLLHLLLFLGPTLTIWPRAGERRTLMNVS